jgi:exodeoxyribonuclease-3
MKIASWNVNSVRARLELMIKWIKEEHPDIILLQETKVLDEFFPRTVFEDFGYNIVCYGQKTYNGVAILSKMPLEDVQYGFKGEAEGQRRYIEAFTGNVRVVSLYVPNGQNVESVQYPYKLDFLNYLIKHVEQLLSYKERLVIGGDYNIAPTDQDVYDPVAWQGDVLCTPAERECFSNLLQGGLSDALKVIHPHADSKELYTWWDYRAGRWPRNQGLRIDHLLLSPLACENIIDAGVNRYVRGWEKTSDHAPVWCQLKP